MGTKIGRAARGTAADDVQLGVRIPSDLHKRYIQAVNSRNVTQRVFIENAIRRQLDELSALDHDLGIDSGLFQVSRRGEAKKTA